MVQQTTLEELAEPFSRSVGVEKARDLVESAADAVDVGAQDAYDTYEVVEICEYIEETHDGYVAMVARDLQVREQAQQRFHGLLENIADPTTVVTFSGATPIVRTVNTAFEEVFGYEGAEIVGESLNEYIVPESARAEAQQLDKQARQTDRLEREVRRETVDGELRDFLFRLTMVETPHGTLEGYGVYTDITERKERERELERQNEQLDRFASVVSHDLRNPLNVAQARLELLAETGDHDHIEPIARSHERMATLVEDLLTLARQGQTVGEVEVVELETCVAQAWAGIETTGTTLDIDGELGTIRADPDRLIELLVNLCSNAVEHAGPDVTVCIGSLEDGFYVADDGPGIPETERDQVFAHGYTTADEGTGFGLSIVESIVEAHDWTLSLADHDDGTRFEIADTGGSRSPLDH